jgi:hypothetical protein
MTTFKARRIATEIANGASAFGIRDMKRRETGYKWTISALRIEALPDDHSGSYYTHTVGEPTDLFRVWGSPTRDGKNYGPAFNYTDVLTMDDAEKLVAKRISNARNRDARKFGPQIRPSVVVEVAR